MYQELEKRRGTGHIRKMHFARRDLGEDVFAYTTPHDVLHLSPLPIPRFFQFAVSQQAMMVYGPEIAD